MTHPVQSNPARLADMLGQVRAEIKLLKRREDAIRARIVDLRPNAPLEGADHVVTIRRGVRRSLDTKRLPPAIRDDPQFWKETPTKTVLVRARARHEDDHIQLIE